ncbi:hypothetical protein TSA1_16295 [Bradyrhizobium nitroreducens]|uniref:Uncharacterized protein n=1 Tax=Bradyrhizobium nitroreducens TaxID=709803 RepID=A0A2M6UC23_9BRAD|nr:hypothetical protein [Bradyrhizobium nitroreducens]PIT02146.1 hypothetical protein TSA1_16295 [Bradyrhizobium nitroreducens]
MPPQLTNILLLVLFFAVRRGFLVLDRAWLMSLGKFLLTGIVLAAAFWLIAHFSGASLGSMHFRDELTLFCWPSGALLSTRSRSSCCSAATGWSRWCAVRRGPIVRDRFSQPLGWKPVLM